jgi:hypothetical protein
VSPANRPHVLSYCHAPHAGNHADVLKHLVLVQLLDYLTLKDKPKRPARRPVRR